MQQRKKKYLQLLFDGYISNSFHVAFAVVALTFITYRYLEISPQNHFIYFVFFSTIFSYNFTKYFSQFLLINKAKSFIKISFYITIAAGIAALIFFFYLQTKTQIGVLVLGILNFLYVVPLSRKIVNLRNLAGTKVYIVSLCWSGTTCLLPILEHNVKWHSLFYLWLLVRFLFVLILLFIFDIRDLKGDHQALHTIPQQIGIKRTKQLAYFLSIVFFLSQSYLFNSLSNLIVQLILLLALSLFIYFIHPNRSKYYTLFWVESLPILWYLLLIIFQ